MTTATAGVDPYLTWARLTGFNGYRPHGVPGGAAPRIELLAESDAGFPARAKRKFPHLVIGESPLDAGNKLFSMDCTVKEMDELLRPGKYGVVNYELASARFAPAAGVAPALPAKARAAAARGSDGVDRCSASHVLVVIDDGFGFLNSVFADRQGGSRVVSFWDQGGTSCRSPWRDVAGFGYGCELAGKEIQRLWQQRKSASDEEAIYKSLGYASVRRTATHGTHVAGCAVAGVDPGLDFAIMLVQLPRDVSADTSGAGTARHVLDGVRYALDRVSPETNVVVNVSFGALAGPHDGTTLLERSLDALIRQEQKTRGFAVVLPAGNSFLGLGHASMNLAPGERMELPWQVRRDDPTESFCEIWYPRDAFGALAVRLFDPAGHRCEAYDCDGENKVRPPANGAALIHARTPNAGGGRSLSLCALAPTMPLQPGWEAARAGRWRVELRNRSDADVRVDAWIQRDNAVALGPYPSRQSFFPPEGLPRKPWHADRLPSDGQARRGTGNCIAHGEEVVVVGGVHGSDFSLAGYMSMQPMGFGRPWPDFLAVTDKNRARPGILGPGTFSGTHVWMNGTSVAAPHAAGIALGIVAPRMNTRTLRARLAERAIGQFSSIHPFERERSGSGRII